MAGRRPLFPDATIDGRRSRPRGDSIGDLDITPMIDVTFLLLIFFMVSSTMQATPDLRMPVARHGVGVASRGATVITVKQTGDAPPRILLGEGAAREGTLADVQAYVEEGLRQQRSDVIIKAEGDISHGFVMEVERAVSAVEGVRFNIGVEDPPVR